ncbi:MAG: hypothetical protein EU548_07910 [Promethearchaeota archaeon]|nr:MAG: hypothetical protein EU548_07910 [Candidatus Lokiarchaeota archaeon]
MFNNHEETELNCYVRIINAYLNKEQEPEKTEIWKNRALIYLMRMLDKKRSDLQVRNALILLITLFEDIPPDLFNNRGTNIKKLSKKEKENMLLNLKQEFLPN